MLGKVIAPFFSFTPLSLCCVFVMCLLLPALIHSPLSYASVIPRPWDAKLINWLNAVNSNAEWHKVTSAMFPETDNNGPHARTVAYSSPPPKAEPPLRAQTKVVIRHLSPPAPTLFIKMPCCASAFFDPPITISIALQLHLHLICGQPSCRNDERLLRLSESSRNIKVSRASAGVRSFQKMRADETKNQ